MNSSARGIRPETVLLAGGALSALSVGGQFFTLYSDGDFSTAIGRFRATAAAIEHFAPLWVATMLLLWGAWASDRRVIRGLVTALLLAIILLALAGIPLILPDAKRLASSVASPEVARFRGQVVRELFYLISIAATLSFALWRFLRRTALV